MATSTSHISSITSPFGSWPMDIELSQTQRSCSFKYLQFTSLRSFAILEDKYFMKILQTEDSTELVERELKMMILAGDCSVSPVGRVFSQGVIRGIVMPYETPLAPAQFGGLVPYIPPKLPLEEKLKTINQLCTLVSKLHHKGIVHGDIKPSNLLCSDGVLHLCDFADAKLELERRLPRALTTRYCSPFISRSIPLVPLTKAEDLYATGVSIWEIYTGLLPFSDIDDEDRVEEIVRVGLRPDLSLVDDCAIAKLVIQYLDSGDRHATDRDVFGQGQDTCIQIEYRFRACIATPKHTYTELIRCERCVATVDTKETCANLHLTSPPTDGALLCTKCRPVVYQGV